MAGDVRGDGKGRRPLMEMDVLNITKLKIEAVYSLLYLSNKKTRTE